jgi:hypothetical protein
MVEVTKLSSKRRAADRKSRIGIPPPARYRLRMFNSRSLFIAVGAAISAIVLSASNAPSAGAATTLRVPTSEQTLSICVPAPEEVAFAPGSRWQLIESGNDGARIPATVAPALDKSGAASRGWQILANVPPRAGAKGERQFTLAPAPDISPAAFQFADASPDSLRLSEGARPVLVYNHGVLRKAGVPADRARSTYVHPFFGLDGEMLTDDFPKDHYHHRGLFWAWPHVRVGTNHCDLWMLNGIAQRFERWLARETGPGGAVLGVENGWYVGDRKVMQERVWLRVFPTANGAQAMDVELTLIPQGQPISLTGAEGKSYGGLTLRYAPSTNVVITTPQGNSPKDLPMTRLPWADLTAKYPDAPAPSGAAIFIAPDHPDYPPMWLTRHYGVLCVGWPGVDAKEFPAGEPIRCRYRVWIHRGATDKSAMEKVYAAYLAGEKSAWK